ncbi:hypothetical protein ACFZA1_37800 [Streptomyces filipinensis]|uniref:hypothetical protein n=1 Tax=Streptomyces filipinensis TaxID=66887 RepID=UPI0036F032E2
MRDEDIWEAANAAFGEYSGWTYVYGAHYFRMSELYERVRVGESVAADEVREVLPQLQTEMRMLWLANASAEAVADTAGTDRWDPFRYALARWFGRGDIQREQEELERLDQTATVLQLQDANPGPRAVARRQKRYRSGDRRRPKPGTRGGEVGYWRTRFRKILENLGEAERQRAVGQLWYLVAPALPWDREPPGDQGVSDGGLRPGKVESEGFSAPPGFDAMPSPEIVYRCPDCSYEYPVFEVGEPVPDKCPQGHGLLQPRKPPPPHPRRRTGSRRRDRRC